VYIVGADSSEQKPTINEIRMPAGTCPRDIQTQTLLHSCRGVKTLLLEAVS
jgi:hypothetical protein